MAGWWRQKLVLSTAAALVRPRWMWFMWAAVSSTFVRRLPLAV